MSNEPTRYEVLGFNTVGSLYWMTVGFAGLGLAMTTQITMRGGSSPLLATAGYIWIVGVFVATVVVLKRLGKLEQEHRVPDEAMKLAFHCASTMPVLGYIGLVIGLAL